MQISVGIIHFHRVWIREHQFGWICYLAKENGRETTSERLHFATEVCASYCAADVDSAQLSERQRTGVEALDERLELISHHFYIF